MNGPLVEKGGALDGDQVQLEELLVLAELCIHQAIIECRIGLKMILPIRLVQV
jgi:hypothetical protein